jgi:hypothetical protein
MTPIDLPTGLYAKDDFLRLLSDDVARALVHDRPYAVVTAVPQRLPGEGVAEVVRAAATCVRDLVRDNDIAGHLDDDVLAVGLSGADEQGAQVFAYRLQGDLRLRSYHLRSTIWETGYSVLARDGTTADDLIAAAVDSAKSRRRRMAESVPQYAITIPPALGEFGPR